MHIGAAKSLGEIAAVLEVHVPVLPPLKGDVSLCVAAYRRYEELRRARVGHGQLLEQQVSAFWRESCFKLLGRTVFRGASAVSSGTWQARLDALLDMGALKRDTLGW